MHKQQLYLIALVNIILAYPSFADDSKVYLSPQKATAILADGKPWLSSGPDGKPLKLTLNKDGTGSINGPMPFKLSVKWFIEGETVCLNGLMGTKCLRFQEIAGGFQGWEGNKPEMKLAR